MTRRTMLLGTMAFGALGRVQAGQPPSTTGSLADCGEGGFGSGTMGNILPPRGVVVALLPMFALAKLSAAQVSAIRFWFEDERGRATPADVETFPNVPGFVYPVLDFRWSPRSPLEGGRTYRLMLQQAGARPSQVHLSPAVTELHAVEHWSLPPPPPLLVSNVLLTEGGLGDDCTFPRRELRVRVERQERLEGKLDPRAYIGYRIFEIRIVRYPGKVDYRAPPQFLVPLVDSGVVHPNEDAELPTNLRGVGVPDDGRPGQQGGRDRAGLRARGVKPSERDAHVPQMHDPAIYLDLLWRGDRFNSFLPRYACTAGLREFDAAGNLAPPFELYVPAAPEVPGLPEEAWLPFGR